MNHCVALYLRSTCANHCESFHRPLATHPLPVRHPVPLPATVAVDPLPTVLVGTAAHWHVRPRHSCAAVVPAAVVPAVVVPALVVPEEVVPEEVLPLEVD